MTVAAVGVRDVARGLFEVRGEPSPFDRLGEGLGNLLAGEMHSGELRHRVVAVLGEHAAEQI